MSYKGSEAVRAALGLRNPTTEQVSAIATPKDPLAIGRGPAAYVQAPRAKGRRDRLWRFSNPRLGVEILSFAGAHREPSRRDCMRRKPDVDIGPGRAATSSVIQALLAELTENELKQVAIAVIRENRSRLQNAHELFEELDWLEAAGSTDEHLGQLRHDYRIAMLNLHAQHQVVSLVVERLGFVPEIDGQRPVLN